MLKIPVAALSKPFQWETYEKINKLFHKILLADQLDPSIADDAIS